MKIGVFVQNRNFFGAKLIHTPLFDSIQKKYPNAEITALAPYKDHQFFVDMKLSHRSIYYKKGYLSTCKLLNQENYKIIFNLRPEPIWLNLALATQRKAQRFGFKHLFSKFSNTTTILYDKEIYRARAFQNLISKTDPMDSYFLKFPKKNVKTEKAVFILSGGGAGEFKRWGIENFLEVCKSLYTEDTKFYFVIGPQEQCYLPLIETYKQSYPVEIIQNASIETLSSYFQSGSLFISNDCGPAHIAQMLKRPMIMILSDEFRTAKSIQAEWFLSHPKSHCIIGKPNEDIKNITVDSVLNAARDLIELSYI